MAWNLELPSFHLSYMFYCPSTDRLLVWIDWFFLDQSQLKSRNSESKNTVKNLPAPKVRRRDSLAADGIEWTSWGVAFSGSTLRKKKRFPNVVSWCKFHIFHLGTTSSKVTVSTLRVRNMRSNMAQLFDPRRETTRIRSTKPVQQTHEFWSFTTQKPIPSNSTIWCT